MTRKKAKETPTDKTDKFELTEFPVDLIVSSTQLEGLVDYSYEQKGVTFADGTEFLHLTVTGPKLREEVPVDENTD